MTISPTELTLAEGDENGGTYQVSLIAEPTGNVTVSVSVPSGSGIAVDPTEFMISAANWQAGQTVTVTAGEDDNSDDEIVVLTHAATGAGYENVEVSAVRVAVVDGIDPEQPGVSIADARGLEVEGQLVFAVTLTRRAGETVRVNYATSDGTARAGEDYQASTGTATIAAGEDSAQIVVSLSLDLFSEPDETFEVTLTRAEGARLDDAQATGTIEDPAEGGAASQQWLARLGRIAGGHVMTAIGEQIEATRVGGSQVTLAGNRLTGAAASSSGTVGPDQFGQGEFGPAPSGGLDGAQSLAWPGITLRMRPGEPLGNDGGVGFAGADGGYGFESTRGRAMSGRELLANSAFLLNAGQGAGKGISVWGRGDYSRFDNPGEGLQTDGNSVSATFGMDWGACRGCLFGVAVSHTLVEATYGRSGEDLGELESSVTGLYPYFGAQLGERISVWGLAGQGWGELISTPASGAQSVEADLRASVAGLGARGELLSGGSAFSLAVKTDAMVSRTSTGEAEGILEAEGDYRRLRLGLEGAWLSKLGKDSSLRTSFEVAAREDAGHAENGLGVEVGGALEFLDLAPGLSLDLAVRGLVSHEAEEYEEWGVSGGFRYDPDPGTSAGPLVSLSHSRGPVDGGGLRQAMWQSDLSRRSTASSQTRPDMLSAKFAYGFKAFGALAIPWASFGEAGAGREYRLGYGMLTDRGMPSIEIASSALGREYRLGWEFTPGCRMQVAARVLHTTDILGKEPDTGFEIMFRSIPGKGSDGGGACESSGSLLTTGAPR